MNLKNKHIIQNRIKEIKKKKNKIFFKGLKTYNYFEFKTKLNSINFVLKCLNLLSNGYILVLKDSISSKFLDTAKKKLKIFAKKNKSY